MPNKNLKKAPVGLPHGMATRAKIAFQPDTFREADNSVEFTLATEEPAMVWDWQRFEVIREVLVSSGVSLPSNNQIPLIDSHDRSTTDNIFGSVRDIKVEDYTVIGRLYFASDELSQRAMKKVKEGHIDSGSVGYEQQDSIWIPSGESIVDSGRTFAGPLLLTRKWSLKEFSLVAIGADPYAKARSEIEPGITSREAVDDTNKELPIMEPIITEQPQTVDVEAIKRAAVAEEVTRAAKITELCTRHNCPEMAAELIRTSAKIESVQDKILDTIATRTASVSVATRSDVQIGKEADEKFRDAVTDGMLLRAGMVVKNPAAGAENMRGLGFADIARESLRQRSIDTSMLGKTEILTRAQATGDFPKVLANVANKAMMIGYQAAPSTWRAWAKKGILPDFKTSTRARLSDAPDMLLTLEGAEVQHGIMKETGETISLATMARKLVITRQALINDDMGVFNTLFRAFGFRAANLIEATAYGILTANAALSDGTALFDTSIHKNKSGSAGDVTSTTMNALQILMGAQTGENGSILSVMPRFVVGGFDNKMAIEILCNSTVDTTASSNANYNPFGGLTPIISGHITTDKWYIIADPNMIDTVEVAFLDGVETPTLSRIDNENDILGSSFMGYLDIGAKALDFRGMAYNGA